MSDRAETKKTCFVIGPIGEKGSPARNRADMLLEYVIRPAVEGLGFDATRADGVNDPGTITDQIINATLSADLVIADLTDHNPNAFYELGIRHSEGKPTVHMILEGQSAPFDLSDQRHVKFNLDSPEQHVAAREDLAAKVAATLEDGHVTQNPVTRARGHATLSESADTKDQMLSDLLDKVTRLDRELQEMQDVGYRGIGRGDNQYVLDFLRANFRQRAGIPGLLAMTPEVVPAVESDDDQD